MDKVINHLVEIIIPVSEYKELLETKIRSNMFVGALLANCELGKDVKNKTVLSYNDFTSTVLDDLKTIFPKEYGKRVDELEVQAELERQRKEEEQNE